MTLAPSGALAAWLAPRRVAGAEATGVRTAFVPAGGGPVQRSLLGGGLRDAANVATFPTGDGGAGVAWLEPDTGGRALLRAALPGGARPADPPAPLVHVGRPFETVLRYGRPLRLPVACDAACDVRVQIAGANADGELSLARAGRGVLHVYPEGPPFATRHGGPVRLRLFSGAPGAARPALRTLTLRLRLRTPAPLPQPYDLRAVRRPGDRIRVTWAVTTADERAVFLAYGVAKRGGRPRALNGAGGMARRRFAPASASAAPLGEVPFSRLMGDVAWVSATGGPDEVAVAGDDARGRPGIGLLRAGPGGLTPAGRCRRACCISSAAGSPRGPTARRRRPASPPTARARSWRPCGRRAEASPRARSASAEGLPSRA